MALRFESGACKGQAVTAVNKVYLIWAYHHLPMSAELTAAVAKTLRQYGTQVEEKEEVEGE